MTNLSNMEWNLGFTPLFVIIYMFAGINKCYIYILTLASRMYRSFHGGVE